MMFNLRVFLQAFQQLLHLSIFKTSTYKIPSHLVRSYLPYTVNQHGQEEQEQRILSHDPRCQSHQDNPLYLSRATKQQRPMVQDPRSNIRSTQHDQGQNVRKPDLTNTRRPLHQRPLLHHRRSSRDQNHNRRDNSRWNNNHTRASNQQEPREFFGKATRERRRQTVWTS